MRFSSCAITATGKRRPHNEDNYYINSHICSKDLSDYEKYEDIVSERGIYAVCDGMGGYSNGDVASFVCVRVLDEYKNEDIDKTVNQYISDANNLVCELIQRNSGIKSGATLAMLYLDKDCACSYNVGDSRVYFFRNNQLTQLSVDHTQAQRMVNIGLITSEQAKKDPGKHVLTQHIGIPKEELSVSPHTSQKVQLAAGDRFIICSDGLTDMVSDVQISDVVAEAKECNEACEALYETAMKNGGKDNITVIVIDVI